jgi:hypothetical protein
MRPVHAGRRVRPRPAGLLALALVLLAFVATPSVAAAKNELGSSDGPADPPTPGASATPTPLTADSPGVAGFLVEPDPGLPSDTPGASATPTSTPATPTPSPSALPVDSSLPGYDISYPQCGKPFPTTAAFRIVGVNGGRPFTGNPCLGLTDDGRASQLAWAGRDAEFYLNTANPGPRHSNHWPAGQDTPRACDTAANPRRDTDECAYDYGWNAAADAYRTAVEAYRSLGWIEEHEVRTPVPNRWWLDVETGNSWSDDADLNVAVLQGAVDYLESVAVASVGFYSTQQQWDRITGGSDAFEGYSAWHAGARSLAGAWINCTQRAFTGGQLELTQYLHDGFDANYRCD